MILKQTDVVWIGDSDAERGDVPEGVGAILNVAQDMVAKHTWDHGIECMQVGLIDGPGNDSTAYCAAVLALHALLQKHSVLVCCHSGGRALAVVLMHQCVLSGRSWQSLLDSLQERVDGLLPTVHLAHRDAFIADVADFLVNGAL